jgi:hypothetical protein
MDKAKKRAVRKWLKLRIVERTRKKCTWSGVAGEGKPDGEDYIKKLKNDTRCGFGPLCVVTTNDREKLKCSARNKQILRRIVGSTTIQVIEKHFLCRIVHHILIGV